MQQEQISRVDKAQEYSPDPVDVFMEGLMQKLPPLMAQQAAATRTKLVGMSWVLAMLSLIVLGCLTYLFLSQGAAGISAGGVQLGTGLSPSQQLLGIAITSLAVVLVNIVFNIVVFREKRQDLLQVIARGIGDQKSQDCCSFRQVEYAERTRPTVQVQ